MADETPIVTPATPAQPQKPPAKPAADRLVMITGATAGIGRAAAEQLARTGCSVIVVARDPRRGAQTVEAIRNASGNDNVELIVADLSLMQDVRRVSGEFAKSGRKLDTLVNNAGVKLAHRTVTAEGFETTLAVNHLAPYLLSRLFKTNLAGDGGGRIVNVNSFMHRYGSVDLDDLQRANGYSELNVYSSSKLLSLLATYALARKWKPESVFVNAYNPGFVRTNMSGGGIVGVGSRIFAKSPLSAGQGLAYVATSPQVEGSAGGYFQSTGRTKPSSRKSYKEALQTRVVQATKSLLADV